MSASNTRLAASVGSSDNIHHRSMATGQDERLLSGHTTSRQYGATDHRVSFGADAGQADRRSSISSSSTSSSVDDAGLADGESHPYYSWLALLIAQTFSNISVHALPLLAHTGDHRPLWLLLDPSWQVCMVSYLFIRYLSRPDRSHSRTL